MERNNMVDLLALEGVEFHRNRDGCYIADVQRSDGLWINIYAIWEPFERRFVYAIYLDVLEPGDENKDSAAWSLAYWGHKLGMRDTIVVSCIYYELLKGGFPIESAEHIAMDNPKYPIVLASSQALAQEHAS